MTRVLGVVLVTLVSVACAGAPSPSLRGADGQFAAIEGASVLSRGARIVNPGVTHDELVALATANSAFALDLYKQLASSSDDNILLGPLSVSTALAMVLAGARGQTATDMARVLHWQEIDDVSARFNALDFALLARQQPGVVDLREANQAFIQPSYQLNESYLETLSTQFGAPLAELEFGGDPDRARRVINDWTAKQTNDRIKELFPERSLDSSTVLVVVNAMSLDASWRYLFDPAETGAASFTLPDGSNVTVPTMHFNLYLPLAFEPDYSAVELMYGRGDLSMLVILPDDLDRFEANLDVDRLQEIADRISDGGIHLALPRFSFKRHLDMEEVLTALGMGSAFGGGANFSGMVDGGGLYLQTLQHEAFIEVDETGTEAHAATGGAMAVSHGPTIEFNRPFFFAIRDRITGQILFVGRVSDPRG